MIQLLKSLHLGGPRHAQGYTKTLSPWRGLYYLSVCEDYKVVTYCGEYYKSTSGTWASMFCVPFTEMINDISKKTLDL